MTKTDSKRIGVKLKPIAAGVFLGIAFIMLILLFGALLISGEKVTESFGSTLICIAAFLGTACGGLLAARKNKSMFLVTGIIVGLVMCFLRMILSAFSSDGMIFDMTSLKIIIFLILGGIFGGLMAGKKRHKRKK